MEYISELGCLSQDFIKKYPQNKYPELMFKLGRPYNCLFIDCHSEYFICLSYRSNINHNNAFMFKKTRRSINNKSGIDYSKMVIINDNSLLITGTAIVDQDEYKEVIQNMN